jgi:hypothetical protein
VQLATPGTDTQVWVEEVPQPSHHQRLEVEGRISHTVDRCPERPGRAIRAWSLHGWQDVRVPSEQLSRQA